MEAAVRCAPPGPRAGRRQRRLLRALRQHRARTAARDVDVLDVPSGGAADPATTSTARLDARALRRGHRRPLRDLHRRAHRRARGHARSRARPARVCLVDSVTGVGGAPLPSTSGRSTSRSPARRRRSPCRRASRSASRRRRTWRTAAQAPGRGLYFDLVEFEQFAREEPDAQHPRRCRSSTRSRPSCTHGRRRRRSGRAGADRGALGPPRRDGRAHATRGSRSAPNGFGIGVLAPAGQRSPTVTADHPPRRRRAAAVVRAVAARGFVDRRRLRQGEGSHVPHRPHGRPHARRPARCLAACDAALAEVTGAR